METCKSVTKQQQNHTQTATTSATKTQNAQSDIFEMMISSHTNNVRSGQSRQSFGPNVCWTYCLGISFWEQIGHHSTASEVPDESVAATYNFENCSTISANLEQVQHSAFQRICKKCWHNMPPHPHACRQNVASPIMSTECRELRLPTPCHVNSMPWHPLLRRYSRPSLRFRLQYAH